MKKKPSIRWDIPDALYLFNIIVCKDVLNFSNNWHAELAAIGKHLSKWSDNQGDELERRYTTNGSPWCIDVGVGFGLRIFFSFFFFLGILLCNKCTDDVFDKTIRTKNFTIQCANNQTLHLLSICSCQFLISHCQ